MLIETNENVDGYVKSELHKHVAVIEFFHPKGNSLTSALLKKLTQEIHYAANNQDANIIVIRSAGTGAFCGGASLDELSDIKTEEKAVEFFSGIAHVINAMRKCPKLIIARVHGKCVGSGVGLIAATDYAIAQEGADIKLTELSLGFGPYVIAPALQRKLGFSAFSQLAIDSLLWRSSDWARRKGLYAELHPNLESMEESLERLSHSLTNTSRDATAELKNTFWKDAQNWDELLHERAHISAKLLLKEETQNEISKFKNKTVS
ncbi:MAG: enoyl-CoA hydratase/isomerase family protein [Chitinophagaceae bacterium]|jgi:methylglutaconyl-CoA hydratase|nr:enoyl-CoA hydratase/isomerase family protein [Chitinophagaceae bacterium]